MPSHTTKSARPTWIFGYGSLIWKQDFPYLESRPARISGWARRFWQGSHDHRGLPDDPGRVVTLVSASGETCAGRAFLIEPEVLEHLDHREKNGYERLAVEIEFATSSVDGLVYRAAPDNRAFLGPRSMHEMALQINRCSGPSGTNRDYVLQLARALRELGVWDPHVFEIEEWVLSAASPYSVPDD
jgi:cation transport protein ChaC